MIARPDTLPQVLLHGGKGASLLRLHQHGYHVPAFYIIEAPFFDELKGEHRLAEATTIIAACEAIQVREKIQLDTTKGLAVRSSALVEDSASHSFAGQFRTVLNVSTENLYEAIAQVFLSGYAASVKAYKQKAGLVSAHSMAVIIQEMIPADTAGVGFGIHPLTGDRNTQVINAVRGLGEKLVSGEVSADSYEISPNGISQKLTEAKPVLGEDQLKQLSQMLKRLEHDLGAPQDIEFAYFKGQLYLLQSRPITSRVTTEDAPAIIWDNSNIVESYPGLTLPLTFSFIEKMYDAVYRQFSLVLGVSRKKVDDHAKVFASMLGLLNGRVYYNLNSWYGALALLPGYSINARYMEGMMGVKEPPPIPMPVPEKAGLRDYWDLVVAVAAILKNLRHAKRSKADFIARFNEVYSRFHIKDFATQASSRTWQDYTEFERLMLSHWKAPLVNDFFAMIYFGVLKKLTAKYIPGHPDLRNELVGASGDIITTEPIRILPKLAVQIAGNADLKRHALSMTASELWTKIQEDRYSDVKAGIQQYLDVWGERCVAELKLETITYTQEPERLVAILQSYITGNVPLHKATNTAGRESAESIVKHALAGKWIRSKLYGHVLSRARYFVSNRENLRYYRTKGFGLVRKMMMGIGTQSAQSGLLNEARDIFYLKLDEVSALAESPSPMQSVVARRKERYKTFAEMPLPERIITKGALPEYIVSEARLQESMLTTDILQGTPCSAGVVRARIRLVKDASELVSLDGCIMATYATDPGYVVLFPTSSGILTERGSLLSHAAIVSREMGIPCIVGIDRLMDQLKDGDEVIMNGQTGIVKILRHNE
jgi:phosphohistidine swiveling domain-containing protein